MFNAPANSVGKHTYDLTVSDGTYQHVVPLTVYIVDEFEPPTFISLPEN